jgi:hypothetical protein
MENTIENRSKYTHGFSSGDVLHTLAKHQASWVVAKRLLEETGEHPLMSGVSISEKNGNQRQRAPTDKFA